MPGPSGLTWPANWASPETVAVAVGNVDSFVSFPGAGAEGAGTYVMVVGTSICDLVVHQKEIMLTGITGVARDGIVPGLFGYEAGQPAVGDMLGWFADILTGPGTNGGVDGLPGLERAAAALAPAQTGLVALDWWNGNRSVLADADLSGVVAGLTLTTTAVDIYRSLLESIAFGNKAVLDNFRDGGLELNEVVACGGIAEKSPLLMQMLADVSGLTVDGAGVVPGAGAGFGPIWRRGCRPGSGRRSAVSQTRPRLCARRPARLILQNRRQPPFTATCTGSGRTYMTR